MFRRSLLDKYSELGVPIGVKLLEKTHIFEICVGFKAICCYFPMIRNSKWQKLTDFQLSIYGLSIYGIMIKQHDYPTN